MGNIRNPRAGCALHGALATLEAIENVVPIVQANAGCAMQHYLAYRGSGGYIDGLAVPASNIIDKQVIFGGGSRLREQIKNTVKVVDGQLYVVLGSCECAMVGDDLPGMAKEAAGQGLSVVGSNIAGFHGDVYRGYERVFLDLIEGLPDVDLAGVAHSEIDVRPLVNLFGIFPGANPYCRGDLEELRRILEGIGLRVNSFFGPGGKTALQSMPDAALNLVFSRWGEEIGARLEEKYATPQLVFDTAPLGFEEVSVFVQVVTEYLDLDASTAERFLEREAALAEYFLLGAADRYFDEGVGKTAAIVGDTETALRIGGFLSRIFGVEIRAAALTDRVAGEALPTELAHRVYGTNDAGEIAEILLDSGADLVLASSLEESAARALGAPFLPISHPVLDRAITHKTYAGLRGALTLVEDYLTLARQDARAVEARLAREITAASASAAV
jgi:nitrogenase molybdenum-iron protein beta chain